MQGKNFRLLDGIPLWQHLIRELGNTEIYIDTDCEKLIKEYEGHSTITAYKRKQKYIDQENDPSNKESPVLRMTEDFIDMYVEDEKEPLVITHVTSPFLKMKTILKAVKGLNEFSFVHSVKELYDFAWCKGRALNFEPPAVTRTQDLEPVYVSCGAFFCFTKETFKKYKSRLGEEDRLLMPLSLVEGIEIDTEEDFEFAEIVCRGLR